MDPLIQEIRKASAASRQVFGGGVPFAKLDPSLTTPTGVAGGVLGPAPLAQAAAIAWMLENEDRMPIFPMVNSEKQSGEYREWPKNTLHYVEAQKRAIGTEARNIYDAPIFQPFSTEMYALKAPVYDEIIANQNAQVDYVQRAGVNLAEAMARTMIKRWISVALKADAWDARVSGVTDPNISFHRPVGRHGDPQAVHPVGRVREDGRRLPVQPGARRSQGAAAHQGADGVHPERSLHHPRHLRGSH